MTRESGLLATATINKNTENDDQPKNEAQKIRKSMYILKLLKRGVKIQRGRSEVPRILLRMGVFGQTPN
jgi:hypothetical protein